MYNTMYTALQSLIVNTMMIIRCSLLLLLLLLLLLYLLGDVDGDGSGGLLYSC